MEIFTSPAQNKNLSLALGFFDGVHLAHKKILETAVLKAKENDVKSAVVTFRKSPGGYFDKSKNINIQTLEERLELIEKTGIDCAYVLDFEEFKELTAEEYLNDVLIKNFSPKFITAGFNHTFGANKGGNGEFLRKGEKFGYKYIEIEKMRFDRDGVSALISSTNIKKFLEKAYIKEANALLGYDFRIKAKVVEGLKLAQKLGAKTANLIWPENIVNLPFGVYCVYTEIGNQSFPSIANFGLKPTAGDFKTPVLEVHLFNFNENIYDKTIKVNFKKGIRPERKFNSLEELKIQIQKDIALCKNLFEH